MNRYNIFNRLIIELRLKNSRFIVCVPNVSNLKTSKFQIATASVVADESEGRSGREQIPASGEAALVPQPGMSKRSELQCTAIVCHPSPDWGGGRGCRDRGRWPQAVSMAAGPSSCPSLLFSWAGKSVQQRTRSPTQKEVKSPDHRVDGSLLPSNSS